VDLRDSCFISLYIRELNFLTDTLTKPVLRDEKRKLEKDMKQAKQDAKQARKDEAEAQRLAKMESKRVREMRASGRMAVLDSDSRLSLSIASEAGHAAGPEQSELSSSSLPLRPPNAFAIFRDRVKEQVTSLPH